MKKIGKYDILSILGKGAMGMVDGERPSYSHGKGHLPDPSYPDPQEHADAKGCPGMSAGKGGESQDLGTGKSESSGSINNLPGKGPGTAMGMSGASAKGLAQPFGSADTKKP